MSRWGLRLIWAAALALALFQFALAGSVSVKPGVPRSLWNMLLWPWLSRLLITAPIVAVALTTAARLRPHRPERLAAALGAIGGFCFLALPIAAHLRPESRWLSAYILAALAWSWALPLAVSCWMAANYWRTDSWPRFWRGPGGAILKGGLVAGLVVIPLWLASGWYAHVIRSHLTVRPAPDSLPTYAWGLRLLTSLHGITVGGAITALLVSWRPGRALGAFAGSGLGLGVQALLLCCLLVQASFSPSLIRAPALDILRQLWPSLAYVAVLGAIAGSFAGRRQEKDTA